MLGYLSADIICSEKRTVFRERSSRKTVSFEEHIMSKDKYPSIFSHPNWGYCVYYPPVLKIGEYPRIFEAIAYRSLKNSGLQRGLNPWPHDTGATLTNWAMKPLMLGAGHLLVLMSAWRMDVKWYMKWFIYWGNVLQIICIWQDFSTLASISS